MNESSGTSEPGSDAELLNKIRSGEPEPFDLLRERHATAARNLAGHLALDPAAADDLVTRAFARVLDAIRRGGGPTDAFRPYLLTAVRRMAHDGGGSTMVPTDEQQIPDPGQPLIGSAAAGLAASPVVTAFVSLPERWRAVLWHIEIERVTPAEAAPLLGLSAADVADLADRARDGLRRAYSQLQRAGCGHDDVGLADAGGVGAALRGTVAPVILGGAATAYLADLASSPVSTSGGAGVSGAGTGGAGTGGPGTGSADSGHPAAAARSWPGAAGSWLVGGLRGTTARQRTLAAGTAALLAMFALAGYTLSLNPATGPGAAGHRTTGGVATVPVQTSSPQAPPVLSPPAPTPANSAATPGRGDGPSDRPPAAGGSGASPTFATPIASAPSSAPPSQPTPSPSPPSRPIPSPPAPSPSIPSQPTPAPTPSRPMPVGSGPAVTAQISVFGPVGPGHVAEAAFGVAVAGPTPTGPLTASIALPAGSAPMSAWSGPGLSTTPSASPDAGAGDGAGTWWHRNWRRTTSQWPSRQWAATPWPAASWPAASWRASPWPGHRWPVHRWPGR